MTGNKINTNGRCLPVLPDEQSEDQAKGSAATPVTKKEEEPAVSQTVDQDQPDDPPAKRSKVTDFFVVCMMLFLLSLAALSILQVKF